MREREGMGGCERGRGGKRGGESEKKMERKKGKREKAGVKKRGE